MTRFPFKSPRPEAALWATGTALAVVLATGGIPGAHLRSAARSPERSAIVDGPYLGDGALDVVALDGPQGAPLSGVDLRAFAMDDGRAVLAASGRTDGKGRSRLSGLPRGEVWVLADAPGRARTSSLRAVDATVRSIVVELGREHTLEVELKDDLGARLPGGEVEIAFVGDPLPVGARTDRDGVARIGRLGAAPWQVVARAPGFESAFLRVGEEGARASIMLRKLGAIRVRVIGGQERPAPGARVAVAGASLWPARSTETGLDGAVRIGSLEAGTYALRATLGDQVSPIELGVTLGRGDEAAIDLRLAPGRFVSVLVADGERDDADFIAGARVTVAEGGISPFPIEGTTDGKGRVRLGPIGPGSGGIAATVSAQAEGFMPRGGIAVADPPPGRTRVVLVRAGVLSGRVIDARGDPIDGATIEIVGTDLSGGPVFEDPRRARFQTAHFDAMLSGPSPFVPAGALGVVPGPVPAIPAALSPAWGPATQAGAPSLRASFADPWVTRADGTFRAAPASPGRIRAVVRHPQYVEVQSDVVTLVPGGEASVDVQMHEGGMLQGRVVDADDRPVAGARVLVWALRGSLERTTRSANDGTFAFAALPEDVIVSASVEDDETPDGRQAVTIPERGLQEITLRLSPAREALSITVVDEREQPIAAAQVSASSLSVVSPLRTTAFTDARGEAHIRRASGLPLRVEVRAPAHAPCVVTTDGASSELRITMPAAEHANGRVVARRGHDAIANADVTLYTDLGARHMRTDVQGSFSVPEIAPGSARVLVSAKGYVPVSVAVAIPESGGRRAASLETIELDPEGVAEGTVVDGAGIPIPGARVARDHAPTWLLVGSNPGDVAVTDARGHFALGGLPEGAVPLEAYAAGVGRGKTLASILSGRTTDAVQIVIGADDDGGRSAADDDTTGGVAVTLGETGDPVEVIVVSVVGGSEAERAGLAPGDWIEAVGGEPVHSIEEARSRLSGPVSEDVVVTLRREGRPWTLRLGRQSVRR